MKTLKNYINGQFVESKSDLWIDVRNPALNLIVAKIPRSDVYDIDAAVNAANRAFPKWSQTPVGERSQIFKNLASLILKYQDEFAKIESINTGKPLSVATKVDIPRSAYNFEFFADEIFKLKDEFFENQFNSQGATGDNTVIRAPLGVVACISPWNLPLYLLTWKLAPALITGNCVIAKPSEVTPMTAARLCELIEQAGFPPGVLNIVHGLGNEAGRALVLHPRVKAVSFTGSTATGKVISELAAPMFKKLSLEMGGKNATLVFESSFKGQNSEKTLDLVIRSAFSNQGQICLCGSRILVSQSIYEEFKTKLALRVKCLKVGDPLLSTTDQGSLVSKDHHFKVTAAVELAKSEGGRVLVGGNSFMVPDLDGFFYEPTLIENLKMESKTAQQEIFGPVATLHAFDSEEEAIALANQSEYGLSAVVLSEDLEQAKRVALVLEVGIVWINTWMARDLRTPFGGVKKSGLGREGGLYALQFFTEPKTICVGV